MPLACEVQAGVRVRVRFQGKERPAIVVSVRESDADEPALQPVLAVIPGPRFTPGSLDTARWTCRQYPAPLGLFVNRLLPHTSAVRSKRTLSLTGDLPKTTAYIERMASRAPKQIAVLRGLLSSAAPLEESAVREKHHVDRSVIDRLIDLGLIAAVAETQPLRQDPMSWPDGFPRQGRVLLKSHNRWPIYTRLAAAVAASGGRALLLAPDILLAEQLAGRLRAELAAPVDVYHSALKESERGAVWERARNGAARILVGTRSALFLPLDPLDLLILDEEHDPLYKQSDMLPTYHARRVAAHRAQSGLLVFGSSAPSLETDHAARNGQIAVAEPPESQPCRTWRRIDLHEVRSLLAPALIDAVGETLARQERVAFGVVRKGTAQMALCSSCARLYRCASCGSVLAFREASGLLVCPRCGRSQPEFRCANCWSDEASLISGGIVALEATLRRTFPAASIARIDADALKQQGAHRLLLAMEHADLLIGTQLLTKGPPLDNVTLAAAVDIDVMLGVPDFRTEERTFQFLMGIAGRTARGTAVIQTRTPTHELFQAACVEKYETFAVREREQRKMLFYPPFSRLARIILTRRDRARHQADIRRLRRLFQEHDLHVLGPSAHPRRREHSIFLLKSSSRTVLQTVCWQASNTGIPLLVDLDPDRN